MYVLARLVLGDVFLLQYEGERLFRANSCPRESQGLPIVPKDIEVVVPVLFISRAGSRTAPNSVLQNRIPNITPTCLCLGWIRTYLVPVKNCGESHLSAL